MVGKAKVYEKSSVWSSSGKGCCHTLPYVAMRVRVYHGSKPSVMEANTVQCRFQIKASIVRERRPCTLLRNLHLFHFPHHASAPLACSNSALSCLTFSLYAITSSLSLSLLNLCSSNSLTSTSSSPLATTACALVTSINRSSISSGFLCFISIASTLSHGVWSDGALSPLVLLVGAGEAVAEFEPVFAIGAKKTERVAGPDCSGERSTVMETAGLWYFRRGRYSRHTLRGPMWPSSIL